jgi:hypothetical protein
VAFLPSRSILQLLLCLLWTGRPISIDIISPLSTERQEAERRGSSAHSLRTTSYGEGFSVKRHPQSAENSYHLGHHSLLAYFSPPFDALISTNTQ